MKGEAGALSTPPAFDRDCLERRTIAALQYVGPDIAMGLDQDSCYLDQIPLSWPSEFVERNSFFPVNFQAARGYAALPSSPVL